MTWQPPKQTSTMRGLPEFDLSDKVYVVTGGARGLGLVQVEALIEAGAAAVFAFDRLPTPDPKFEDLQKQYPSQHLQYVQVDVTNADSLQDPFRKAAELKDRLDGLVAAAGIQYEAPALEYTAEDCRRILDVNVGRPFSCVQVTGVFLSAKAAAQEMIRTQSEGSIILIASMSGSVANRDLDCVAYNASKAGVLQMGRNLACEWGKYKIRVNTISPGYIETTMVTQLFEKDPERKEVWSRHNPLGRISVPEEYRAATVFLAGNGSSFMTGSDLKIDGGHTAW